VLVTPILNSRQGSFEAPTVLAYAPASQLTNGVMLHDGLNELTKTASFLRKGARHYKAPMGVTVSDSRFILCSCSFLIFWRFFFSPASQR
jgi:hypothetical protein